jgi:hypothetical protein
MRHDPEDVGVVRPARSFALLAGEVALTQSLADGVLDGAHADAGLGGDAPNRQITDTVMLDLAGDDEEHGALALGVRAPDPWRHVRRAGEQDLYRAWSAGLIGDAECAMYDVALRKRQGVLYRPPVGLRQLGGRKSKLALGWPRRRPRRMPDREASRARARTLAGSAHMPPRIRGAYTECERAVLFIVAREVKPNGICDLAVGRIAAEAGVCASARPANRGEP